MSRVPDRIVVASRGSTLALTQTEIVAALLRRAHPGIHVEVTKVTTRGDRDGRPFSSIGGKGLFVGEVEREVQEGRADVAVHSAKDLTADLAEGCAIVCVPARAAPHDVVVGPPGENGSDKLAALAPGARVGTSSMRRRTLLAEARDDLVAVELRGNLDTRLAKVAGGDVAAAILAAAGIERLGAAVDTGALDSSWWVPAPAQGALAVEARADRLDIAEVFAPLDDEDAHAEVTCERAFAARLEGGCSVPLGCLARAQGASLVVTGYLGDPFGSGGVRDRISGPVSAATDLGRELADAVLASGGDELLAEARDADTPEPTPP